MTIARTLKLKTEISIADSVSELVHAVHVANKSHPHPRGIDLRNSGDWIGREFSNWDEAVAASDRLWGAGVQTIEKMLGELAQADLPRPKSRKRTRVWSEDNGDGICLDRLRDGQPFWNETKRVSKVAPATVTIVTDMAANAHVDSKNILWRGAAAAALTFLLEQAGYRVELWAAFAGEDSYRDGASFMAAACIKRPQDPLDLGCCASAVSGWFFRLFGIGAVNLAHDRVPRSSCGYHITLKTKLEDGTLLDEITRDENRILIEEVWNYKDAVKLIQSQLAKLCGTAVAA